MKFRKIFWIEHFPKSFDIENSLDHWISKPFHARKIAHWFAKWQLREYISLKSFFWADAQKIGIYLRAIKKIINKISYIVVVRLLLLVHIRLRI